MDFIGDLVGGPGCAADGTTAARNPVSQLVGTLMEGSAPSAGGKQRGAPAAPAGYRSNGSMAGPPPAQLEAMHRGIAQGMAMGQRQVFAPPPPQHFMHGAGGPGAQMVPRPPPDAWIHEFRGMPPPGAAAAGHHAMGWPPEAMEQAWREQAAADAWAAEFGNMPPQHVRQLQLQQQQQRGGMGMGMPPPHIMEMEQQRREMEAAWGGQRMAAAGPPHDAWEHEFAMRRQLGDAHAPDMQAAWAQQQHPRASWADAAPAMTPQELDAAWAEGGAGEAAAAARSSEPLGDAWSASAAAPAQAARFEGSQWAPGEGAASASAGAAAAFGEQDDAQLNGAWDDVNAAMESAWHEARAAHDPELEKVWEERELQNVPGLGSGSAEAMNAAWERTAARLEAMGGGSGAEAAYDFRAGNPRMDDAAQAAAALGDFFAEGMRHFEAGDISEAVMCFEAELKKDPSHSEAWRMLGQSHAENDQDPLAIACLERAVEQDPYNLEALLALGVSYVNELDSQKALATLRAWVRHNPKYAGLEVGTDEYSDGTLMDEVMQLMLQAERWDANDADAKVVLGVLYNVSRDYGSAAEAFRASLAARPGDHSLWNKLGATLANDSRSGDALPAYSRALRAKPRYARAWLNLGISHANLNRYDTAAACYLRALRLNPAAKHVWSYLRIVFTCMERFDLVQRAGAEDAEAFSADFPDDALVAGVLGGAG